MSIKLPSWATRDGLPELVELGPDLTRRLVEAAARRELDPEQQEHISAVCERVGDASEFLWTLIDRWEFKGAGEHVMFRLFGWLAGAPDVSRLGELLRRQKPWTDHVWARIAPRHRGLRMLAEVDSPLAWLEIARFANDTRLDDLYREAHDLLYWRARQAELDPIYVDDLCAPTLGFDEEATRRFDFGPRSIQLVAREPHDVYFVDERNGRRYATLPRAQKADDPTLVEAARETWRLLKPQLVEVFDRGESRLEVAMVRQRRWSHAEWRRQWWEHPLLRSLCRRVVWIGHLNEGPVEFVLAEDEATTLGLETVSLDAMWEFEVAHPTELDVAAWTQMFTELELVQPIVQLSRCGRHLAPTALDPGALVRAQRWGWERRARVVGKMRDLLVLRIGDLSTTVYLDPGIAATTAGRVSPNQAAQRVADVEVRDVAQQRKVPATQWPARIRCEVDLLLRRAAL